MKFDDYDLVYSYVYYYWRYLLHSFRWIVYDLNISYVQLCEGIIGTEKSKYILLFTNTLTVYC